MPSAIEALAVASYVAVGGVVVAIAACAIRRWRLAAGAAAAAWTLGLAICLALVGRAVVLQSRSTDPAERAVLLTEGVSETVNVGAVALLATLASATVWSIARRRTRRQ